MFAKDFDALNALYSKKIVNESVGLGPKADNSNVTPSTDKMVKVVPPLKDCNCEGGHDEGCEGRVDDESESNGEMCRQLLFRIHKVSAMLHDILNGKDNVEAWILSKLTNAHDQIQSVFGYEDYKAVTEPTDSVCNGNLEENNEEDLYNAISSGGEDLVKQLQSVLKRESRETLEKVLFETIVLLEKKK